MHFSLGQRLGLDRLLRRIIELPRSDRWEIMARAALRDDLHAVQAELTAEAMGVGPAGRASSGSVTAWEKATPGVSTRSRRCARSATASRTWPRRRSGCGSLAPCCRARAEPGPRCRPATRHLGLVRVRCVGRDRSWTDADRPAHPLGGLRRHRHARPSWWPTPRAAGLAVVALTDHDTFDGLAEARAGGGAARDRGGARDGAVLLAAAGRACTCSRTAPTPTIAALAEEMELVRGGRTGRLRPVLAKLAELGVPVTEEEVLVHRRVDSPSVGRPHIADAMVAAGHVADRKEAFDRFLADGGPAHVARYAIDIGRGVDLVHGAGGVAVIAHPWGRGREAAAAAGGADGAGRRARAGRHRGRPPRSRRRRPGPSCAALAERARGAGDRARATTTAPARSTTISG